MTSGQICYEAVAAEEPAGKHIALAKKVSCKLTLNDVQDDLETSCLPLLERLHTSCYTP